MSCIIPPVVQNPFLHNVVVKNLQSDLGDLTWLDNIYPLADIGERTIENERVNVPIIYGQADNKNYIAMFPDNKERSGCFFELDPGTGTWDRTGDSMFTLIINIQFWANLNRIADLSYDFTDQLMGEAMKVLSEGTYNSDITRIEWTKDKNLLFSKYGYTFKQFRSFMYPMTGFRLQLEMQIDSDISCIELENFNQSFSPC